ncbi:hypothetical protein F4804DRAFT_350337 [Jackrogersella minutella]|nr:hypothetical protein F4804DRAFT_350337 [Jackrogersella minutella]
MNIDGLIHRVSWAPAALSEEPLAFTKVVFFVDSEDRGESLSAYRGQLADKGYATEATSDVAEVGRLSTPETVIVHIPHAAEARDGIYKAVTRSCTSLIAAAQILHRNGQGQKPKLFSLFSKDSGVGDLSRAPLHGLARVIKMEMADTFGGLFEEDQGCFPLEAIKHAQGFDVVRVRAGVAQTASLQPRRDELDDGGGFQLDPDRTYLITGGTRGIGLETAAWMSERGARHLLLASRNGMPPASGSEAGDESAKKLSSRIAELEALGVSVHTLAVDFGEPGADAVLRRSIDELRVPPVKGVVHAAGIAGWHTLDRCAPSDVAAVLAPKVLGSLSLDTLFPPGTLDFFVLMSSVGQLVGFPGQLSYAPANAFLDGLAAHRRSLGDNSTSILWSSWRGVGMLELSKSAMRIITKGMQARGIEDLRKEEAFEAWDRITSLRTDHAVVVRATELNANEPLRHPMLKDITPRRPAKQISAATKFKDYPENAVAVVGMACRTAAGDTPEELWEVIQAGRGMEREIDVKRFPDAVGKGKMWGNFLSDISSFDHQFFKKSKRESSALDPHQHVLLETTYHALESAGCFGGGEQLGEAQAETHDDAQGAHTTGCFIGMNSPDYQLNLACHPASPYTGFGMLHSFVAGRLSHHFGWTGPSQTIDTACSSAMVAIHQACRAIQVGECTRAVAGGANLITNTTLFEALRVGGFLNETGACKTFDARADGYCRGEAVGVLVLKRLDRAVKDEDDIQGVLLSTGNNQNINSTSITNPVLESQMALYRDVLARAGVNPGDVSYVEAHGTGTRAGDPVETEGIRQVLGGKDRRSTLHIGAVKPNVGHSEAASGVVSLIKVLLMMKHGKLAPQAHFKTLNPNIPALEPDQMAISTSLKDWRDDLRLAIVNNYGASGNNAAAVVAPPPQLSSGSASLSSTISKWPFLISSSSNASLLAYCDRIKDQIDNGSFAPDLAPDLAFALAKKQNRRLQQVFCTTATSLKELRAQLSDPGRHIATSQNPKPVVLLFSGQNGNTVPSARRLYDSSLLFQTHLHRCDEAMQSLGLPSLVPAVLEGLQGDSDLVLRHAVMFAIQYSFGMSWIDSGVMPQAICGHSFGEWAALTVSGAMTLEAGMKLITGYVFLLSVAFSRASIIQKLWGDDTGSMIAIEAGLVETHTMPAKHLEPFRKEHPEAKLDVACYNGPNAYVVAGKTVDIELLESYLNDRRSGGEALRFKVLKGMHAYHSEMADPIIDESAKLSTSIPFQDPTLPFESCQEEPWTGPGLNVIARNTRGPVYFARAISRIVDRLGSCTFLEAGVGGPIIAMARNALPQPQAQEHTFVAISGKDPVKSIADATVALWKVGQLSVQFWPFHRCQQASYKPVVLPPYQFEKHRHWLEYTGLSGGGAKGVHEQEPTQSELCPHCSNYTSDFPYIALDESQGRGAGKFVFKVGVRSRRYQSLVGGHEVVGSPTCPAPAYLELASHAVALLLSTKTMTKEIAVEGFEILAPLGLDAQRSVVLVLTKKGEDAWGFEVCSSKNGSRSSMHAKGVISLHGGGRARDEQSEKNRWARASSLVEEDTETEALRGAMVYKVFRTMVRYSPAYKGLRYLVGKGPEGAGDIVIPANESSGIAKTPNNTIADPLVMDNFMQVPGAFVHSLHASDDDEGGDGSISYICIGMDSVGPLNRLQGNGEYRAYTKIVREDSKGSVLDAFAFDKHTGKMVWSARGLRFLRVPRSSLAKVLAGANPGVKSEKEPVSLSKPAPPPLALEDLDWTTPAPPNKPRNNEKSADVLSEVQEILSKSLDVPVGDVTKEASLEELGADSLVASEILANISDKFNVDISTEEFITILHVAALCDMISSRLGNDDDDAADAADDLGPDSTSEEADGTGLEWQKKVFEILSQSLDLPVAEIRMDSKLEDIGSDSLIAGEIVSNLNEAFGIDISSTEFASTVDVVSLCGLISGTAYPGSVQTPTDSSSGTHALSTPRTTIPTTPYTGVNTPTESEKPTSPQGGAVLIHAAFQQTRRNFDARAEEAKFTGYWDQVYPRQLSTIAAFIVEAFEKLGCPIGEFGRGEKLPALRDTLAKYHREVSRLWEILEEAGVVEKSEGEFLRGSALLGGSASRISARELSAKLVTDFPQFASAHGLSDLVGPHLADCLAGRADAVSLLFGNKKGRDLLEDFYANAPDLRTATQVLCNFFSAAIRSRGSGGEPFRVLEVGAGTGGTTKHLVPLLRAAGVPYVYTFTELSISLLQRAKKAFGGDESIEFLRLDIEHPPPEELLGRYHVVVSSNCVHATRDVRGCLASIRRLVRPRDGCVALVEYTHKHAWLDLVMGLLDGWWLFDDGREHALQSPWEWERAMRDVGFSHVDWSDGVSRESRSVRVICGMAAELERPCPAKATSMLLHRGASSSGDRNLFLAPDGFGSGAVFGPLQPLLGGVENVSVYALNSPFIKIKPDPEQPPTIEELAAIYVAEVKRRQPRGPYLIGGYSIGGIIAYEMTRQLLEDGNEVERLFLIDAACPTSSTSLPSALVGFLESIDHLGMANEDDIRIKSRGRPIASGHFALASQQLIGYKITKLPGRKTPRSVLVSAREGVNKQDKVPKPEVLPHEQWIVDWFLDDRTDDGSLGWEEVVGDVSVIRADGNHFSMMKSPMINTWGLQLVGQLVT